MMKSVVPSPRPTVVYSPKYNYYKPNWFPHPFNPDKPQKIFQNLLLKNTQLNVCAPLRAVTNEELEQVHDTEYLLNLQNNPAYISRAIDFPRLLDWCPKNYIDEYLLEPMRWQCAGTIETVKRALLDGAAINIGGGYHHARRGLGWGGCVYADIPLAIYEVQKNAEKEKKIAIIDLDAHQGDGLEEFCYQNENVYLFDMHNKNEFPFDPPDLQEKRKESGMAEKVQRIPLNGGKLTQSLWGHENWFGIKVSKFDLFCWTEHPQCRLVDDPEYLEALRKNLPGFLHRVKPDLVIYNAGTDPYMLDPWGCMNVSREGIFTRDQYVWNTVREQYIPIAMTLSGGYSPDNVELNATNISQLLNL